MNDIVSFSFSQPLWFLGLAVLLPLLTWYYFKVSLKRGAAIKFSSVEILKEIQEQSRWPLRHVPFILRMVAVTLIFFCAC